MMTRKDGLEVSSTVPGLGWTSNGFKLLSYKKHSALSLHCTNGLSFPLKIILIAALRPGIYYGCCIAGQIVLCTNPVSLHITVSVICTVSMKNFQQITVMNCGLFLGSVHLLIVKKKKIDLIVFSPFLCPITSGSWILLHVLPPRDPIQVPGPHRGVSDSVATPGWGLGVHL